MLYRKVFKRFFDVVLSGVSICVLSPVMLVTALLVRAKLGSPVIFSQDRPGRNEQLFKLHKFRTMTNERNEAGELLPDEIRLTKFGRTLRSTSLDELPELFNIFKGDMSIVGPRPLLVRYLPYYTNEERRRHTVRPGLTGIAQVNGRNNIAWDQRLGYDLEYVDNISFITDMKIILQTILKVFKRSDVASGEELLMEDLDIERKDKRRY